MSGKRLFIYCAGGTGRDVLHLVNVLQDHDPVWNEIYFIDDSCSFSVVNDTPVWTWAYYLEHRRAEDVFLAAHGEPRVRRQIVSKLSDAGCRFEVLIAPDLRRSPYLAIDEGVMIFEGALFRDNISVGAHTYLSLRTTLGHNATVGQFCTLAPGCIVSGNVTIGNDTYVGAGTIIRDEVSIGKNCIIGMGSLVTRDIPDNVVAYGSPCRVVRENTDGIVFR